MFEAVESHLTWYLEIKDSIYYKNNIGILKTKLANIADIAIEINLEVHGININCSAKYERFCV